MNDYFVQKIDNLRSSFHKITPNFDGCRRAMNSRSCKMYFQHITVARVVKMIKSLKGSRGLAVDGLGSFSFKISAENTGPIVHHIITLSVMQNKFPEPWKYAKVIPIHKKGDVLEKKNYRPVSILSPVSKVLERVLFDSFTIISQEICFCIQTQWGSEKIGQLLHQFFKCMTNGFSLI